MRDSYLPTFLMRALRMISILWIHPCTPEISQVSSGSGEGRGGGGTRAAARRPRDEIYA